MINELSLLKLHPENSSTKQKIISILCESWPLTAKQIYERLQKNYSLEISYQGAHKTLKDLEEENVILRKNDGYLMNIDWVQKSKKSLENVEKRYLQNEKIIIPKEFEGTIQIEFDTTTDLSVSTAELLLSRQLAQGTNDKSLICTLEYGWWPFKFKFEQFYLLFEMVKKNPKAKVIIRNKTPFGEWIRKQYIKIGGVCVPIGTHVDIDEDLFVQGDCIIEIKLSDETKKIIEHYYNKWHDLEGSFIDFSLTDEPKIQAVMRITKNKEMAEFIRKQLNKAFEGKVNE